MKTPGQRPSSFHICDILDIPDGRGPGGGVPEGGSIPSSHPHTVPPPPPLGPYTSERPLHASWTLPPDHHGNYLSFINNYEWYTKNSQSLQLYYYFSQSSILSLFLL